MRGLSIFLGSKDIGGHLDSLSPAQRESIGGYFRSSRTAAIANLRTVGKLLSGYDENFERVSAFEIGWLVATLATDAEAGDCLDDLCEGANLLADIRSGKVAA
jgi:hypothetical protein